MATAEDPNNKLPPYPQMIIAAIDALNEKMGSNKTSISKYIESNYHNLPATHSSLLKHHLNRMKDSEDLIFWKNNYMKPDPNFIRRGRGRPRKEPGMPATSRPVKPPKAKDEYDAGENPIQVPAAVAPEKKQKVSPSEDIGARIGLASNTKTGRPRGRPPKVKPQLGGEGVLV